MFFAVLWYQYFHINAQKQLSPLKQKCLVFVSRFPLLCKVMASILLIPVSNASCERVFSFVRKSKTIFRSSLSTGSTEALTILKVQGMKTPLTNDLLEKCAKATANMQWEQSVAGWFFFLLWCTLIQQRIIYVMPPKKCLPSKYKKLNSTNPPRGVSLEHF